MAFCELKSIFKARLDVKRRGEPIALATILNVEGSSYRRAGARMLIDERGETRGSVSGGCLERDLVQRGLACLRSGEPTLIEYDTTDEGDALERFSSVGLGCNGRVRIWLERVLPNDSHPFFEALEEALVSRKSSFLCSWASRGDRVSGGYLRSLEDPGSSVPAPILRLLPESIATWPTQGRLSSSMLDSDSCRYFILREKIAPPFSLSIVGAGHDAIPMAKFASSLGWDVVLVDCRSSASVSERHFSGVDRWIRCAADCVVERLELTADSAVILMTHNYYHDLEVLKGLLSHAPIQYVGLLGPKKRGILMLSELERQGARIDSRCLERFHSPVGLDLGAESPEEIALSACAEIQTVLSSRPSGHLRDRTAPIHEREL